MTTLSNLSVERVEVSRKLHSALRDKQSILIAAPFVAIIGDNMVNEFRAVVAELGGERALGRVLANDRDMRDAIRDGFPPAVVEQLMRASGLTLKELASTLGGN
jgi:hypothetical protein